MTKTVERQFVPVNEPLFCGNEKKYLLECIESGWISSEGLFVTQFERQFAERIGKRFGIAVSSGSAALDVAVAALGLGPGDEVIMPTFTIISCAQAVVRAGAKCVLVDSDPLTWNMNAEQIESKITEKTRAVMAVHIYGLPVDMDAIADIARRYNLALIEDAAQAHGLEYKGMPCGGFGNVSTFSFYANKIVSSGEGGMVLTDDEQITERCRSLRNLCFRKDKRFVHEQLGWNYRMTNLQAAAGLAQLEQLDRFVEIKRRTGAIYNELLADCDKLQLPVEKRDYAENIYWVYGVVLKDDCKFDAEQMANLLAQKNIGTRPFFWPMHQQPVFKRMGLFENESYPIAEKLARRGLYLPSGLGITNEQIKYAAGCIKEMFE